MFFCNQSYDSNMLFDLFFVLFFDLLFTLFPDFMFHKSERPIVKNILTEIVKITTF